MRPGRSRNFLSRTMAAAAVAVLAACAAPTPYGPARGPGGDGHGYAEQALEHDRVRVTFSGNSVTSRETVENYLLYRAAEVTLARGRDHFVVVEKDTERTTTYHSTIRDTYFPPYRGLHGSAFYGPRGWHPYYGYHPFWPDPFAGLDTTTWPVTTYSAYANIVLRAGPKPADDANAYDARAVRDRLAPVIARKEAPVAR